MRPMRYARYDKQSWGISGFKKELNLIISKSSQQFRDRKKEEDPGSALAIRRLSWWKPNLAILRTTIICRPYELQKVEVQYYCFLCSYTGVLRQSVCWTDKQICSKHKQEVEQWRIFIVNKLASFPTISKPKNQQVLAESSIKILSCKRFKLNNCFVTYKTNTRCISER
jgi:hypothetical protein